VTVRRKLAGGTVAGYTVTLPGLTGVTAVPVSSPPAPWGEGLAPGQLRVKWRAGKPGAAPPGLFEGAAASEVWEHAAAVARSAAAEVQPGRAGPGVALAAADVLTVAADVLGSPGLRKAADDFGRAVRISGRSVPPRDPLSDVLRTSARLIAAARPPRHRSTESAAPSVLALLIALVVIVMAIAAIRWAERRPYRGSLRVRRRTADRRGRGIAGTAGPGGAHVRGRPAPADGLRSAAPVPSRRRGSALSSRSGRRRRP
jgi:hypothetical protein